MLFRVFIANCPDRIGFYPPVPLPFDSDELLADLLKDIYSDLKAMDQRGRLLDLELRQNTPPAA